MFTEAGTQRFLDSLKALGGPPLHQRSVTEARQFLEGAQAQPGQMAPAVVEQRTLRAGPTGEIRLVVVKPEGRTDRLPAVMYLHGGGWMLGDWSTHQRLVRLLANAIPAALVFVDYERSPEQPFPVALEQAYEATRWVTEHAAELGVDVDRLAVMGDSVGGNLTAALTLLVKERGGPAIAAQILFYPVTNDDLETPSYQAFAEGLNLTRASSKWFLDNYQPDVTARNNPLMFPLKATLAQLSGLPPALIITAENDVLRDEGEAYAKKLSEAGVNVTAVRYLGTVHDFVMLNALAPTPAAVGAIEQASAWLARMLKAPERQPGAITMMPQGSTIPQPAP
jgi:acetyl esterase